MVKLKPGDVPEGLGIMLKLLDFDGVGPIVVGVDKHGGKFHLSKETGL